MKLILEQRYLFDGSVGPTGAHAMGDAHHHHADAWAPHDGHHGHGPSLLSVPAIAEPTIARSGSPSGSPETVLFVDPRVADWKQLVAGVKPGVDVVMLDPNQDGISQVTRALAGLTNVRNVEFLTDGAPGSITLGGTTLDAATLGAYANQITGWSAHLAPQADIVFWGNDVGQGSAGASFVADVHTLTGATVGANSEATGAAALGGGWTLDVATGPLHGGMNPFSHAALANYQHTLETPPPILPSAGMDTANLSAVFDPNGASTPSVLMTDREIVRERATLQAAPAAGTPILHIDLGNGTSSRGAARDWSVGAGVDPVAPYPIADSALPFADPTAPRTAGLAPDAVQGLSAVRDAGVAFAAAAFVQNADVGPIGAAPVRLTTNVAPASVPQSNAPMLVTVPESQVAPSASPETVLFVDPRVANYQQLIAGVQPGVDVIILDPNKSGIEQVTQALANLTNVHNIEFLTDGTPGSVTLGGTTLNAAALGTYASEISSWSTHLAAGGDIVFWGCDVAQGSVGTAFVDTVSALTGVAVGANSEATGAAALGGDWTLDVATGPLNSDVNPFTAATMASYLGVLDTPTPAVALSVTDAGVTEGGTLNLGDTLTVTIDVENTAENATGYTGYVETFAPTALTQQGAATEGGVALTELTAAVSNGMFINPITHQTEQAPEGFTNGTMYLVELANGSLAPGVVAAPIIMNFAMSGASSMVGTSLMIGARAGFLDGSILGSGDNVEGDTFSSTATVIQPLDPSVAIIGTSNDTANLGAEIDTGSGNMVLFDPNGTMSGSPVAVTPGEIVRMRIIDQLSTTGTNSDVSLTMTLPTGVTLDPNYATDGSVTIALVSSNGDTTTSATLSSSSALQVIDSGTVNTGKLDFGIGGDTSDPVSAPLTINSTNIVVNGQSVTFNLGNITNTSATALYAVVEFNVVVGSAVSNGTALTGSLSVPGSPTTTAVQTVQTGYAATNFDTVLDLPLFDSTLGTLDSVTLTMVGDLVSFGTITATSTVNSLKYATSASITLTQAAGGPALPGGQVSVNPVTAQPSLGSITAGNSVDFNPNPGGSTTTPAVATSGPTTYTNGEVVGGTAFDLTQYEQPGGGMTPVDVTTQTFADFKSTGGNFTASLTTEANVSVSISYTYTPNTTAGNAYLTVQAPAVTLTKAITAITYSGTAATVTYVDTIANTSSTAASYGLTLTDTGDGNSSDTINYVSDSGGGTVTTAGVVSGDLNATLSLLPANTSETLTYTETVPVGDVAASVAASKTALATVTSYDLNPALFKSGQESMADTTEMPPTYTVTATAPFDSISGTVNQDTGATEFGDSPLAVLQNETVSVTYTGQTGTENLLTDSSGDFTLLVPDGLSSVTLSAMVGGTLTSAVLDNHPSQTGTPSPLPLPSTATETGYGTSNTGSFTFDSVSGTSYTGITFDFWAGSTPTPMLSVVGGSNDTAGLGTQFDPNGEASPGVLMTDGEIVRERATLNLTAGSSDNTTMTVTLPSGLTLDPNYQTDGSITVLLVSSDGAVTTSLTGAGLQLTDASPNVAKLDLGTGGDTTDPVVTALPSGPGQDVSYNSATGVVTFNLGNLNDTSGNYAVVVEFNAVVSPTATTGTVLNTTMSGSANGTTTSTVNDYVNTQAPDVTLAKTITGISYSGTTATVTYTDTITDSGPTAYGLSLTDVGDGNASDTLTAGTASGSGVGVSGVTVTGGAITATIGSLAGGTSETITYTETIPVADVAASVAASKTAQAQVVSFDLNPALFDPANNLVTGKEHLTGTLETPPTYTVTAVAPLVSISGTVNQDTSTAEGSDASLQGLLDQTVSATYSDQVGTEVVTTDSDGNFSMLVPVDNGPVSLHSTATTPNAPANDVLDNAPDTATSLIGTSPSTMGSNPVVLTFTPTAGASYTGIAFDYWVSPDTAPVLAGGPTSTATYTSGDSGVTVFSAGTATDHELDTSYGSDFSGTTLTIERYVSNVAAPNANDSFTGTGTSTTGVFLNTTNHEVLLNGTEVGTFTESGGKLTISFLTPANTVSEANVDAVLQGIAYSYTGPVTTSITGVVIGAQIDDANNDPISLNSAPLDPSGPHDQGVGGDLVSNVLTATFNILPVSTATPVLSVVGGSNDTAGLGTQFDPNGETSPGVLMTDGEIVRERATLDLTAGTSDDTTMTVTLPSGMTLDPNYATDGSITVLLVSPDGNVTTSLTGPGLQLTDASPNASKLDLGTGGDTTDPVVTALPSGMGQDVNYNSATGVMTFNLGNLNDTSGNYAVVVEFNAVVSPTATTGTVLSTTMSGSANGTTTSTVSDYVNTQAPDVTLAKTITGISYSGTTATVTYTDTITDSGPTAYGLSLTDVGDGNASDTLTAGTASGSGVGVSGVTVTGGAITATIGSLAGGTSETITYTETIPVADVAASVAASKTAQAQVVSFDLNPALFDPANNLVTGKEHLTGTLETPPTYTVTAVAPLVSISGTVNQDTSTAEGSDASLQGLLDQTVSATYSDQVGTEVVTTDSDGNFSMLVPVDNGPVSLHSTATTPNAPANDVLDNAPDTATSLIGTSPSTMGSNPVVLTFTPTAGASYTGIAFDYWVSPDTAPVLAGGPTSTATYTSGDSGVTVFSAGTATDHELDTSYGSDFSGTTLTIERYVSNVAAPNANDSFTGTGTSTTGVFLNTTNHEVLLNGTEVGTFTESGGKLTISFLTPANTVSEANVDAVLQGIAYSYTGPVTTSITGVVIGAQIDDANNDPISLNSAPLDPSGPHDQGVGGDLVSNVLTATFNILPVSTATPVLSVVGGSNDTAGLGTQFDPNGETSPGVLMTDGEIVRERATLDLTAGTSDDTTMTVTLPSGMTLDPNYATDGSITVLLVSPDGNVTTSLTGPGLQLTDASPNASKLDLGTGGDTTDPVVTALPSGMGQDVNYNSATGVMTFNLGNLNDTSGNYAVVVEFNTVVSPTAASGTVLSTTMSGSANGTTTSTVSDYVNTQAPDVTLAKTITGISYSGTTATVTYTDTITDSGPTAYGLSLTDVGDGNASDTLTAGTASGSGVGVSGVTVTGGAITATIGSLAGGTSETITYTETIPVADVAASVAASKTAQAQVVSFDLNPALFDPANNLVTGKEHLTGTLETPPTYTVTAVAPLVSISGTVNQDTSTAEGSDASLQGLLDQTVSATYSDQVGTEVVTTDSDGNFSMLVPVDNGPVSLHSTATTPNAPANDVLDNAPDTATSLIGTSPSTMGSNPVVLTFTPTAGASYTGIAFDYWVSPDTAPVLAGGPTSTATYTSGDSGVTVFSAGTATDHELDTSYGSDFSGTTLTIERYVSNVAAPNANDSFTGTGTSTTGVFLNTTNHEVLLNGTEVGTFTESGGKLTISFLTPANTVSEANVDAVLQGIAYSYTGPVTTSITGVVIGAQIDDANNDPISLNSAPLDPSGPHDQGVGGDLVSNVLTATFNILPVSTATPVLSVVGGSNDTAGLGTQFDPNGETSPGVLMTDGEIVRERATLDLTAGTSDDTTMTVTLPSGMTLDPNYATDGSITVLLVSPDGNVTTSLTGPGLQLTDASPNASKLDLGTGGDTTDPVVTALPSGMGQDVNYNSATGVMTFNLGNLNDTSGNYAVVVEFNTVVSPTAASGTVLSTTMSGSANGTTTSTVNDYVNTQAPDVTLAKTITGISYSGTTATVTYTDTITDSGPTAYGLSLTDVGDGNASDTLTAGTASGSGVGVSGVTVTGGAITATIGSLAGGTSETITYTETIPVADVAASVAASKTAQAQVVSFDLNPALFDPANNLVTGKEHLTGTLETPPTYTVTAVAPLVSISGTVNQDTSTAEGSDASLQGLLDQTVSATYSDQVGTEVVTTDSDGNFSMLVPVDNGPVSLHSTATTPNAPANDVLDNAPDTATSLIGTSPSTMGSNPVVLTFTPTAGASYTGIAFDYWVSPDTAPVLAGGPTSTATYTSGDSGVTVFSAGTATDHELDTSYGSDFSGTTLTIERYVSNVAAPNANDSFTGTGTSTTGVFLNTTNHEVLLNGTEVGTFTESGGKLTISFLTPANTVSEANVDAVLQGIAYSYTGPVTTSITGVVIGAQIDDANNDPISLNSAPLDPSGPHDQGVGGDLVSNVLTATFNILPVSTATPVLSVVGGSNDTAGLGTQFDPNGETSPGVLMTDGEIVRERATLDLTAGTSDDTTMTVTLPSGMTLDPNYATDGSITVLLVSPDGNVTTSLTGPGLQLTDASPNASKLDLGTGGDTTDPVVTALPSGMGQDVNYNSATGVMTFNLGNLNDTSGNYAVVVEFNTVVSPTAASGTVLSTTMSGSANGTTTSTVNDYVNTQAPDVTLAKTITGISYSGTTATVTYTDTITDSGPTAYGLSLTDVGDGNASDTLTAGTASGSGVGVSGVTVTGGAITATIGSLAGGTSETITYTETIPVADVAASVAASKTAQAQVVSFDLNPALFDPANNLVTGKEHLTGTLETPPTYTVTAVAPLVSISGTVNQDTSTAEGSDASLQGLLDQTVSATYSDQVGTEVVTTDSDGNFSMLVPVDNGPVSLHSTATTPNAPANDVLDNAPDTATSLIGTSPSTMGSNPVVLTFTPTAGASYTGIAFDYWVSPDTAPVLAGGPTSTATYTSGDSGVTVFSAGTATDHELDTSYGSDFSGTTLTIERYVSNVAAPNANDSFTGTGTSTTGVFLNTTNHEVLLNGTEVGTFTESGGKLTISFLTPANTVSEANVDAVLQGIAYSYTGPVTTSITGVVIGAQIDDANNDPISLNSAPLDPSGPHDQGVGGDLVSNVLTATFNILPVSSQPQPPIGNSPATVIPIPELPLIPQLELVGSVENRFIIEDQQTVIQVPPDIFIDSDPNAELAYNAMLPDGTPLPSWLSFDANDLTFSGTPPLGAHGRVEIIITARDQYGNMAEASFSILIGEKQEDLAKLLMQSNLEPGTFRPYGFQLSEATPVAPPGSQEAIALAMAAPVHHHDAPHIAETWRGMPQVAHSAGVGGFSAALRAAGNIGALARARALLDGLDRVTQARLSI